MRLSGDRKTSPHITKGGTVLKNAFGLPAGKNGSCPGATEVCSSVCYAGQKIEKIFKGAKALVDANFAELRAIDNAAEMAFNLNRLVEEFIKAADKKGAEKIFRIHWDGDLFSAEYAEAWAFVIRTTPDVQFWIYTRSFDFVDAFEGIHNVSVYLSVDTANFAAAKVTLVNRPWLKVAILAVNEKAAKALHASLMRPTAIRCPENSGRLPLIVEKNGKRMGACAACGLCVKGRRDVLFTSGK